jgi:hypothetical protein
MPIVDIQFVLPKAESLPEGLAQSLVDRLGHTLSVQPGRLWLRLQVLPASQYAENESSIPEHDLPVFVTVIHAKSPTGSALEAEALSVAQAVAEVLAKRRTQIHVEYAPSGAGRIAFGGHLIQ